MMNESYVKRTIASLDDLVDSKLMHAKRVEFKLRIKEALKKKDIGIPRARSTLQSTKEVKSLDIKESPLLIQEEFPPH